MLLNSKKFGLIIEDIVKKKRVSYMEAVLKYCEENEIDTGTVSSLINKSLKEKIQIEAENLNLLEKSNTSKLPI
jgi:hypoxanthine-guanine phosphoribosyltransferase